MSTREQLHATLSELKAELASLDTLDNETRESLEAAVHEIESTLSRKSVQSLQRTESVVSNLRDAVERFESSHPNLTGILSRMADALAQLGI
jgi:tRNA C32,U32 (ribose-2'-O)-methylase TrmJ